VNRGGGRAALAALLTSLTAAAGAAPPGAGLAHCAAIDPPDARLACYDALAGRTPAAAPATPRGAAPAPVAASGGAAEFGLRRPPPPAAAPQAVEARVARLGADHSGHVLVVLDNDQEWACLDQDVHLNPGDPVRVKSAALGSFLLLGPNKSAYRVRRTK
jgi:hypothetical protein